MGGKRLDFLTAKAPPGYVAGLGRGATGFTTRSDIGPARAAPETTTTSFGRGRGKAAAPPIGGGGAEDEEDEHEVSGYGQIQNQEFDEFEGNDVGLFATGVYDADDDEADAVYESVAARMDSRRKERREERLKRAIEQRRESTPTIKELLADVTRTLVELPPQEWEKIPDATNLSRRKKKARFESYVPPPDTLLEKAQKERNTVLDQGGGGATVVGGAASSNISSLTAVGEGRGTVLSLKLDRLSDSVSGLTVVDPRGYLTDLKSMKITSDAEISDMKKARLLLKSVIQTNPKHAPGWIAAARLEEVAGKITAARSVIHQGCQECPKNEDVWLEACRLTSGAAAKGVISAAVKAIPTSVKLWMAAAALEEESAAKSRVLRKGLEFIPDSVRLWKSVVELASEEEARILLGRATECCRHHVELWLALARLETYDKARVVLNRARDALPTEPMIWIAAAKLEEAAGNGSRVAEIIDRAIRSLERLGVVIDREYWMKEAEAAERAAAAGTCAAIVRRTIGVGVEEEDKKRTWVADAEECLKRGSVATARAIFAHVLEEFSGKKSVWIKAALLEKGHGSREAVDSLLERAVGCCPKAEVLWLLGAKEKWLAGDIDGARAILTAAYVAIPESEEIWLAAFKLEFESREPERARILLAKVRERGGCSERVWMKSAMVERELGKVAEERRLLEEGLKRFPGFHKLWLMLGQLEERTGNLAAARSVYERALERCDPATSTPVWLAAAELEEKGGRIAKARALLTTARLKKKEDPELWLAAIRAEARAGKWKEAEALMAKALQECRRSGILWAASAEMAPRAQRKARSFDAVKNSEQDPFVVAVVGKFFWQDRKVDKARSWIKRAVAAAPDIGDFWAVLYRFEQGHGSTEAIEEVVERCKAAEPKHGEQWIRVSKAVENAHQGVEFVLGKVAAGFGRDDGIVMPSSRP
ncbi:hypothetical protein SELMODRAFT_126445 [Selaginella moellendorffii]|uniref:PRP1 splicing factor N-terminal domain-containing protein n=1 Tax=Selaginella moellendorffii TaxID=88036 RepID=D8SWG5_SELML|nr:hypothetical protein SELMODRAFT_126445 [Selaginella moellendorffii]